MSKKQPASPPTLVDFTTRALLDLHAIEAYSIGQWGKRVAEQYLSDIESAVELLGANPHLLATPPGVPTSFYCAYRVRKHYLICTRRPNRIIVLTIIHTAMDLPTRLLELLPILEKEVEILEAELRKRHNSR